MLLYSLNKLQYFLILLKNLNLNRIKNICRPARNLFCVAELMRSVCIDFFYLIRPIWGLTKCIYSYYSVRTFFICLTALYYELGPSKNSFALPLYSILCWVARVHKMTPAGECKHMLALRMSGFFNINMVEFRR